MRGLTLLLAAAAASAADLPWIRTAPAGDAHFYDSLGRTRLFHGANRVQKAAPWYFDEMLSSDAEFELMKSLGFNAMRLGFMWSGYNPAPGVFNETYLEVIQQIVAKMADHGVYALLDMHQDCFSSSFCLYDGIPLWVANKVVARPTLQRMVVRMTFTENTATLVDTHTNLAVRGACGERANCARTALGRRERDAGRLFSPLRRCL